MNATAPSIFDRQHFGQRMGAGRHPALLVVDFTVGFNDPSAFGGGNISEAITETIGLLARVRERGWPVAHTRIVYAEDGSDANVHCLKVPRLRTLTESNPQSHFVPELQPLPGEIIVTKRLPSAFFGTDLAGMPSAEAWIQSSWLAARPVAACARARLMRCAMAFDQWSYANA
jgi:maleamate amidohydrolase